MQFLLGEETQSSILPCFSLEMMMKPRREEDETGLDRCVHCLPCLRWKEQKLFSRMFQMIFSSFFCCRCLLLSMQHNGRLHINQYQAEMRSLQRKFAKCKHRNFFHSVFFLRHLTLTTEGLRSGLKMRFLIWIIWCKKWEVNSPESGWSSAKLEIFMFHDVLCVQRVELNEKHS